MTPQSRARQQAVVVLGSKVPGADRDGRRTERTNSQTRCALANIRARHRAAYTGTTATC
jgi:hypothetical protein